MSQHRQVFHDFEDGLEEEIGRKLEEVLLYGSVARGEETEESDVDVIVVVSDKDVKEKVFDISYDLMLETGVYISPKVLSSEEFQSLEGSSFRSRVEEDMNAYAET